MLAVLAQHLDPINEELENRAVAGPPCRLTLLVSMLLAFAFSISIAVAIGGSAMLGMALFDPSAWCWRPRRCSPPSTSSRWRRCPFFILAGNLMETGGISRRLVDFAKSLVGGVQGGLPMTCVLTCMIFAAVSGSSVATTFAIGAILIPALIKHGYPREYAAALQATSAELGVIIPPSIPMILFGVSAEVSIGELFIAGFGPGLLIGGALMLFVHLYCRWKGWGKNDGDGRLSVGRRHAERRLGAADAGDHPRRHLRRCVHAHRSQRWWRCSTRWWSACSCTASSACKRPGAGVPQERDQQRGDHVHHRQRRAVRLPDHARRRARRHRRLADRGAAVAAWFLLGVNAALFVIGMFIETSAAIIVLAPILVPVARHFGIDPVHFGTIMVVNLALGMITPPFGVNLFAACTVAKISLDQHRRPPAALRGRDHRLPDAGHLRAVASA
jgi:C4-dicarboxylate transporter DctM subunit